MLDRLKQLVREPLVHFLFIGAGIYAVYGIFASDDGVDNERRVTVSAGEIQALTDQWMRMWSRPPTEQELAGVVREHVRTQIFFKEALAMGLDQGDLVIERRLAQKLELLAQSVITPADPTDEELRAWYDANATEYTQPDRYTVTHVFFDPDKRDATTLEDAAAALAELMALGGPPENVADYGDRFMLQNFYPGRTELELQKLFGRGFVDQVVLLEPGEWHGPILSGYGTHLVFVSDVIRPAAPSFDSVEAQVRERWFAEKIDEMSDRFLDNLVSRYEIDVETVEVPITVTGGRSTQPGGTTQ